MGFRTLLKKSEEARKREAEGEEYKEDDKTPEGIRIKLIKEEDVGRIPATIAAIVFVVASELILCFILFYGIIKVSSRTIELVPFIVKATLS